MGHSDHNLHLAQGSEIQLSAPVTVIASEHHLDALRATSGAGWIADADFVSLALDQALPEERIGRDGIVVFEVDPAVPASMDRIRQLRRMCPQMAQIVAMRDVDLKLVRTLVREGVADVVELPFSPEEILQTVVAVLENARKDTVQQVALAPMIGIVRALGGSGGTTVASHLAAALHDGAGGKRVCVFDLDIQSGRMSEVLGMHPRRNLGDLLEAGGRMDGSLLHTVAERHASGIDVIAAPSEIMPIEAIDAAQLLRIVALARSEYDYVVLDLPATLTNWSLNVLSQVQGVVMVVELSLASLRQAKRRLDLFRNLGLDHRLVSVVVNKVEKKLFGGIKLGDVEDALSKPVFARIAADEQTLLAAQDRGVLAQDVRRKSAFVADIARLADALSARVGEVAP